MNVDIEFLKPYVSSDEEYDVNDFDIVSNDRKMILAEKTNKCVNVYLPNGNCVSVYNNGKIEFWDEQGSKIREVHSL